ncbi:MAG TPA: peptidoglycan-binding domain-containing protein, partial [Candidatus Sulfopaludibacter sp.]|nr:peptidoglycan-binding domain-containing protein [Candidatus Sulfopaludibacter sp.]
MAGTPGVDPLVSGDPDHEAVGALQDLLSGFGNHSLPDVRLPSHGTYGNMTAEAVRQFRIGHGLPDSDSVDSACLNALATAKPADPVACRSYISLGLDMEVGAMTYLMTLTGLWEANARFAVLNLNTDRAGLSFGVIQWAQKPGRLTGLLNAFHDADPARFADSFGGLVASRLLVHLAKVNSGVDLTTGNTIDPDFNLVAEPWASRFRNCGLDPFFQRVQVTQATADAQGTYDFLKGHTPRIATHRGVGFLMDTANQHGRGGARSIYDVAAGQAQSEADLLKAMREESVRRITAQF